MPFFIGTQCKSASGVDCRSPPSNLDFQKIQIGGKANVIQLWQGRKKVAADIALPEVKTVDNFLDNIENQQLYKVLIMVDRLKEKIKKILE